MNNSLIKILKYSAIFIILQVIILNNIHLFKIATPFIYLYVIIKMPVNLSRSQVIAISFLLGIIIDTFFDTVGMHAAACSLAGMFRDPLMYFFTNKEIVENATPSYKTLGIGAFMKYVICLVALHHTALFSIESISLFNPVLLIMRIFACVFFTVLIVFIVEAFNIERNKSEA